MIFKARTRALAIKILFLGAFCFGLNACLLPNLLRNPEIAQPPGKGTKAENGYRVCGTIIQALSEYHTAGGEYPQTLKSLNPAYLTEIPDEVNGYPILYQPTQGSYSLEFRYTGPGMNVCTYTPEDGWHCYGYY